MPSSKGDFSDPGIEPASLSSPLLAGRFFTTKPPVKTPHPKYIAYILYVFITVFFFSLFAISFNMNKGNSPLLVVLKVLYESESVSPSVMSNYL